MTDSQRRFQRLCDEVDEFLRLESPAARDQRLQRYIAQAMTPQQRLDGMAMLTEFVLQSQMARKHAQSTAS